MYHSIIYLHKPKYEVDLTRPNEAREQITFEHKVILNHNQQEGNLNLG